MMQGNSEGRNEHDERPTNTPPPRVLAAFSIGSVEGDYLVVNPFNGDGSVNATRTIYVLKPWTLSKTPFDGKTINGVTYAYTSNTQRTATSGTTNETQLITQDYYANAIIYAYLVAPKVKLTGGAADGKYTGWLDANIDARAWAVQ